MMSPQNITSLPQYRLWLAFSNSSILFYETYSAIRRIIALITLTVGNVITVSVIC